jgi:pimeloyl-ACP methyl ester carboxylesterase
MSSYSHETAPTRFVETEGIRFAYRRFGRSGGPPLLFLQHFKANMDGWDPFVTNGLALDHDVILFDNAGVGSSGGATREEGRVLHRRRGRFIHDANRRLIRTRKIKQI